jgi:hypothetical protein
MFIPLRDVNRDANHSTQISERLLMTFIEIIFERVRMSGVRRTPAPSSAQEIS